MANNLQLARSFADLANKYVELVSKPADDPAVFARRLLEVLAGLYSGALALPTVSDVDPDHDFYRSTDAEWRAVYRVASDAFGERDHYWINYDPILPRDGSADCVCASLADDCADIHRDLIGPLMVFNDDSTGHLDNIIEEWSVTPFQTHWGIHATHAMCALHRIVFNHGP